jgi:hypothetical protein
MQTMLKLFAVGLANHAVGHSRCCLANNPTLVQHYYEGIEGQLPSYNLTQTERLEQARSLSFGGPAAPALRRSQGAAAVAYSKQQKILWGLQ